MGDGVLRVYLDPTEIAPTGHAHAGYPWAWFGYSPGSIAIKDLIRERDDHRCLRCKHPYVQGNPTNSHRSQWSSCDEQCTHGGPMRVMTTDGWSDFNPHPGATGAAVHALKMFPGSAADAQWRILTVHHLNGVKADCRWWNLVSLCQRCHLEIQAKVHMQRRYMGEHSEWFKPFVAGYYAWAFLGLELSEEQTRDRLDELLALEDRQLQIEGA